MAFLISAVLASAYSSESTAIEIIVCYTSICGTLQLYATLHDVGAVYVRDFTAS